MFGGTWVPRTIENCTFLFFGGALGVVVVVVVARSVSIVVIQVQVLVRRQVQEHRRRWGVLPEDPWFEVCWVGGTLKEMGSGVRGAAAVWACVSGVGGGVYSV